MHIIHITSELAPLAKVGGLADVVLGLSRELSWKGHQVDIILPKYDCMDKEQVRDLTIDTKELFSFYDGQWYANTVWVGFVENLKVYFIEPHHPRSFFDRNCFYGCEDDLERFLYFSRAALEFLYKKSIQPHILHLHDWQAAAIAPLYKEMYQKIGYTKPKIVFTIHNMAYQGKCASHDLNRIGLEGSFFHTPALLQDNENANLVNLLKGGIVYCDFVTTVSPTYAKEVLSAEGGKGLQQTLLLYKEKFKGILNGIDYSYWNPEIDRFLPFHFSFREKEKHHQIDSPLSNKELIKNALREKLCLAKDHRPLVGCIARLVPQKGIDLIYHTIDQIAEKKGQFVLLGTSPIPAIHEEFHRLKNHYAHHPHVRLVLHHEEELAHLIYAGCDLFIVPSLFEPCGLTQMIALKYGTIPVVRRTGGLADTIVDVDQSGKPFEKTNGYLFDAPDSFSLDLALDRAIHCCFADPEKWRRLMINGMQIDFSWNQPSNLYLSSYEELQSNS